MTFDEYCEKHGVKYFREAFYHYLLQHQADPKTEDEFEAHWRAFLQETLAKV